MASAPLRERRVFPWQPWLLLSPTLVTLMLLVLLPLLQTVHHAFTQDAHGFTPPHTTLTFENFRLLATDTAWWYAVRTTVIFALSAVLAETVLGLALALLLQKVDIRLRGLLLAIMLIPWAIPAVVAARLWSWMLNGHYGILNAALMTTGITHQSSNWATTPEGMLGIMVLVDIWQATPFMTLLALAGLQSLPGETLEAACLDGATAFQTFRAITLPLLWRPLMAAALFRLLDALRMFDLSSVLYGADLRGMTLSVFVQTQLVQFGMQGYAAASALSSVAIIAMTAGLFWFCVCPRTPRHLP
ncbi:sugar ABC transporter permease [Acetobacter persici]|uniref:carbohydrate ABC transporter permease n=1 Tax=Acetobacter persici TaxID=1076596 RepID=UPI001BA89D31|nr:sugar ABC transporter permease [Acetobacter persici]MBS1002034.1 sugar ABC transporter permease [Acetobacter persici]